MEEIYVKIIQWNGQYLKEEATKNIKEIHIIHEYFTQIKYISLKYLYFNYFKNKQFIIIFYNQLMKIR